MEKLLIRATKGDDLHPDYDILSIYRKDFDGNRFQVTAENNSEYSEYCKELDIISVRAIAEILKNFKVRSLLTEVIKQQTQHLRNHLAF